jgi:hypothetical protein
MPKPNVTALKPLTYQGRSYVRGDRFHADPGQALAMARRREVSLTVGAVVTRDVQAEDPEPVPHTRRRYRRRDMTAERS